jgi:predicted permease
MFLQDLRYGVRMLLKSPGFALIAILTLALGIGANTAIFSVVNGVLLSRLPFRNADRIVSMFQDKPNFDKGSISYPNFLDWQNDSRSFEMMALYRWGDGTITGVAEPEDVSAQRVSWTFFPILNVTPILGRNFTADEDRRGANPTAMISEGLWRRKFGSDPNIVGRTIIVAGEVRTIIGVIPASFQLTIQNFRASDLYAPIGNDPDPQFYNRDSFWGSDAIALLKPGVTLEQAREDLKHVNAGLAVAYPNVNSNIKATMLTLKDEMVGEIRPMLLVLLGAVIFVLLIACANVANLLLARSTARQREFAIRAALGAGKSRIVRQLLTESMLLALIGGAFGLMLAAWGTKAAVALVPRTMPRANEISLDTHVLLFTLVISLAAGIVFGLVPALRTSRTDIEQTLRTTGHSLAGARSRTQSIFVVSEVAMAMVLLVGAGLMIRTLGQLWGLNPGLDPHNVIRFGMTPSPTLAKQNSADAVRAALRQIHSTIAGVPGVESVSLHSGARPMRSDSERGFWVDGQQRPERQADLPMALYYVVEPDYLRIMRIPLLHGRFFTNADNEHAARVCVIDANFVDKYFHGQNPIGKYVHVLDYDTDPAQQTWNDLMVVGVVGHVNQFGLAQDYLHPLQAQLYEPFWQSSPINMKSFATGITVFARIAPPLRPEATFQPIAHALQAQDREIITARFETQDELVARSIASQRFSVMLLSVFAGLALLLAGIGIYGVLSYLVGQRTHEIGVRLALGAQQMDVLRMVLGDGARMMLLGAVVGALAALALTRLMSSMLFHVTPTDPLTFTAVATFLCGIGLLASYVPARRAMQVDPMVALRYE